MELENQRIAISGAGNVARYAAEKAIERGAKVVTLSDSGGLLHVPEGLEGDQLREIHELKEQRRGSLAEFAEDHDLDYHDDKRPWGVACDIALPCAVQNELDDDDAKRLVDQGCRLIAEGANMPCTAEAVDRLQAAKDTVFVPGKAANAGGVAVSGLERTQNAQHQVWPKDQVDRELTRIMHEIHARCVEHGTRTDGSVDYRKGANVAGFLKLADAMLAQGVL